MATPIQRSMAATVAAHAMHAQGKTNTAAGRQAFMSRFEQQVDPDGKLDPRTRATRAAHARKAYFTNLSLKASRARSTRAKFSTTGVEPTELASTSSAADRSSGSVRSQRPRRGSSTSVQSADPPGLVTPGAAGLDAQPGGRTSESAS